MTVALVGRARGVAPRLRRTQVGLVAAVLFLAAIVLAALVPALLATGDPNTTAIGSVLRPPGADHWLGTDELGRDVYSRVVHGTRLTVALGAGAIAIAVAGGTFLGLLAGSGGRLLGGAVLRLIEVLLAFPGLLLAFLVVALTGRGPVNIAIALGIGAMPGYARLLRAEILSVRQAGYVDAAVALGHSRRRIVVRHILPNSLGAVLLLAALDFGVMILAASALSFLGLGPQPPTADWAQMISESRNYVQRGWWAVVFPGIALTMLVISVNVVSQELRRRLARAGR